MRERIAEICLICLFAACIVVGCQRNERDRVGRGSEGPTLWQEVIFKAEEVADEREHIWSEKADHVRTELWARLNEQVATWARGIAGRHGRDGIETLISGYSDVPSHEELGGTYDLVMRLSLWIIADIADPQGEREIKNAVSPWQQSPIRGPQLNWHGVAIAAIDLYQDESARNLLLKLAMDEDLLAAGFREAGIRTPPAGFALGFLRTYSPSDVRPAVEGFLKTLQVQGPSGPSALAITEESLNYVRALLASFDYREGLEDEAQRDQYLTYERRLWRSWALAPRGQRKIGAELLDAAGLFAAGWKDGDEKFLLRIFEEPTSSHEELKIAMYLAHRLSDEGRESLAAIAEGTSDRAEIAKHALQLIARRSGSP